MFVLIQILLSTLIFCLGINIAFFLVAFLFKTDKLTDFTYGMTFILTAIFLTLWNRTFFAHQMVLTLMISVWGLRLISYLLVRIFKIKSDKRFDQMRQDFVKFFSFWFFQGLVVWAVMLPSTAVLTTRADSSFGPLLWVGLIVWLVGLAVESAADWQKFVFKNEKKNKGKWIDSGLWKYSRHPNYFGEMLLWWGVFIYSIPFLYGLGWLTIAGPMTITYILIFVSGIPPLEKRYKQKYKGNEQYARYKKNTRLLIPLPKG